MKAEQASPDDVSPEPADPGNYEGLKALAAKTGRSIRSLLAMNETTDPYYAGAPYRLKAATWFKDVYQRFGFPHGVHLRRIHYVLVSVPQPPMMPESGSQTSGQPYANDHLAYQYLQNAARDARHLGLIAADAFVDHRNPEPMLFASSEPSDAEVGFEVGLMPCWDGPSVRFHDGDLGSCDICRRCYP